MTFTAKAIYPGICGVCVEAIHEGDEIAKVDDEWCHVDCARDEGYLDDDA